MHAPSPTDEPASAAPTAPHADRAPPERPSVGERAASDSSGPEDVTRAASSGSRGAYVPAGEREIEGYVLHEELHRGGQGVVYRALQVGTKREVALKVLLEGPFASEDARRRFEREIELAASLRHPWIVTILDSGVSNGRSFYAMELIRGQRLGEFFRTRRPTLERTLALFERICQAVNFAHQRGVIHRDLKPTNILVDEDEHPHILDFGLAKPVSTPDSRQTTMQLISTTGQVLGTVAYMSPEQAAAPQDVDVRSDVYSLGVIFYELLLGQTPYPVSGTLAEVLTHIAQSDPQPPRSLRARSALGRGVDDELATILLKALEKDPARRYQTAGELGCDLRRYLDGEPIEAKRASGLYMFRKLLRRYRVQAAAAGVVLLTMAASLVGFAVMYGREAALRAEADAARRVALDKAQKAADAQAREAVARQEAEASAARLHRTLIEQRIQRGDLARERGDLADARDAYWDAFEGLAIPAARWSLRRHFVESGEVRSHQLGVLPRCAAEVSPDGRLAVTCNLPQSVAVHETETGRRVGWFRAPRPVSCVTVQDDGLTAGAGRGWARVWSPGSAMPRAALELPRDFTPDALHVDGRRGRLLLVDRARVLVYRTSDSVPVGEVTLRGARTGTPHYSSLLGLLAVPSQAGVELVSCGEAGELRREVLKPTSSSAPRAVRFSGDDLLVVLSDVVDAVRLGGPQHGDAIRFLEGTGGWDTVDLRRGVAALALGSRDGRVAVYRSGSLFRSWRVTFGELHDVHFAEDERTLVTRDARGTLTHWTLVPGIAQRVSLADASAVDWAASADGSVLALAGHDGSVLVQRLRAGPRGSVRRSSLTWREPSVGPAAAPLSVSLDHSGDRLVVRRGDSLRLIETSERNAAAPPLWSATWSDGETPLLQEAHISPDGTLLALRAGSAAGDRQRIGVYLLPDDGAPSAGTTRPAGDAFVAVGTPLMIGGSPVRHMAFVPGSGELLLARANGETWSLRPGETAARQRWSIGSPPARLTVSRDGTRAAVAGEDGVVRVFDVSSGAAQARVSVGREVTALDFSPDGQTLAIRAVDGSLRLFDVAGRETVLRWALAGAGPRPMAAWLSDAGLALDYDGRVFQHDFARTDALIDANRRYPLQRAVVRAVDEDDFDAAWDRAAQLATVDPHAGALAREEVLELALRRPGAGPSAEQIAVCEGAADVELLLRMGHAACDGGRFDPARRWLRAAAERVGGADHLDAYSLWRLAECDYLAEDYDAAEAVLAALAERGDFDARDIPRAQLERTAALLLAGRSDEARRSGLSIGKDARSLERNDPAARYAAIGIGRHLAGLGGESVMWGVFGALLNMSAEGSLDHYDDPYFFLGELARLRGDAEGALAHYRRCVEAARDEWPGSWARHRIAQARRAPEPAQ